MGASFLALLALLPLLLVLVPPAAVPSLPPKVYNTSGGPVHGKLNVHLVPHTHDDVGWLKTVDQYFVGSNNSIQLGAVQYILDSVVSALQEDPNRKFIYVEQAFFQRWWRQQPESKRKVVKKLVYSGQLEFVNGGWCMHDEASTHYIDMIDQTTLGHRFIKNQFNKKPRIGWQIDPFGHSAVQAYLLSAEVGFDALFFARADYQDIARRLESQEMEFVWQGSKSLQSSAQIFSGIFFHHYSPPEGMEFDIKSTDPLIQDDPLLYDHNLEERIESYVQHALNQSTSFRSNHIMWTMGGDFAYENANTWFKQMDKIVHYMNKDGRTNVFYSTPSIYVDAKNAANITWPVKSGDFFPYSDCPHCYWTGYFSSRPALKGYVRRLSGYLLAARQLECFVGKGQQTTTDSLEEAISILQHHDGVSGTERQHVADDYAKRLSVGAAEAAEVLSSAISSIMSMSSEGPSPSLSGFSLKGLFSIMQPTRDVNKDALVSIKVEQCPLLNISHCPPTASSFGQQDLILVAYNSLAWIREDYVRIPVSSDSLQVRDSQGKDVIAQIVPLDGMSKALREIYVKLYTGTAPKQEAQYSLIFKVEVPPLGFNTYYIRRSDDKHASTTTVSSMRTYSQDDSITLDSENISLSFSSTTPGQFVLTNRKDGVSAAAKQSYCWYNSSSGAEEQNATYVCRRKCLGSGAYMFRPNTSTCFSLSPDSMATVIKGALVEEIYQEITSWLFQVIRLYRGTDHVEIEYTVGPVPVNITDEAGKEIVMRLSTDLDTGSEFYTDSNGRDFLKRVRNQRPDWNLELTDPVAGNYYPLNLGMYIRGNGTDLSLLVDRASGGSSLSKGEAEVMIHRRMIYDDNRGVGEALNEVVCVDSTSCEGLTVRGKILVGLHSERSSARWRRSEAQKLYSPLELLFPKNSSQDQINVPTFSMTKDSFQLPPNIAIITLQELEGKQVLLRLAHLYEVDEDEDLSKSVTVDLENIFGWKKIKKLVEMNLSVNEEKKNMQRLEWRTHEQNLEASLRRQGPMLKNADRHIEIVPMEVRTFLITLG